jgi:hypothetical protein
MMRQGLVRTFGFATLFLAFLQNGEANAQYRRYGYPGGYGGYGWSQWGQDPASGYMAGLGSYARGEGAYEVSDAQARSINLDTMLKYNKALRERQRELRKEKQAADAKKLARDNALAQQELIANGTSLNVLLDQILEFSAGGNKAYSANAPLSPALIREIPFEIQSESQTVCIAQMTGADGWPQELQDERLNAQRAAVAQAAEAIVAEDMKGNVSKDSIKKLNDAIAALRTEYEKKADTLTVEYAEAEAFLNTLNGLAGSLRNPMFDEIVAELAEYKEGDVGDLIGFMHAFNLRFAPAQSDDQKVIYQRLYPLFVNVLKDTGGTPEKFTDSKDATGKGFRDAAVSAFGSFNPKPAK